MTRPKIFVKLGFELLCLMDLHWVCTKDQPVKW